MPRNSQPSHAFDSRGLSWEWHAELFDHARDLGLEPFSAAFDRESVDFLETLDVKRHKVASFELVDLPLIRCMASKGKPMILSTGMATEGEISNAVRAAFSGAGAAFDITLLRCTSAYPAPAEDAHLAILAETTWPLYGLSDHTLGIGVAVAATALGATYIEKHLTISRADGGPDAGFSMEPAEFAQLVTECHRAADAIGEVKYGPGPNESTALRRSLWVCKDIAAGEPLRLGDNVCTARPALGLPCSTNLEGLRASAALRAGTPLTQEGIA
jgi:N-acetylneuraminate synthase